MSEKSKDLRERLAARGVTYKVKDFEPDRSGVEDRYTEWEGRGAFWVYHEAIRDGLTTYTKLSHQACIDPEQAVAATLGPDVGTRATDRHESFADVVNVLRKAAMGDFPGATGAVDENLLALMDRGMGDSLAGAFDELADRLEEAHNREVGREACCYVPCDLGFTWWDEDDVEHHEDDSAAEGCGSAACDHCGHEMLVGDCGWFDGWDEITDWWDEDSTYHRGYLLKPTFSYCPSCGRVVE